MKQLQLQNILFTGLSLLLYYFVVSNWGLGVTDDSVNFLSAALSFPTSLQKIDGSPFVEWTPLYPIVLAFSKFINLEILDFVTILHGVVFGVSNYFLFHILSKNVTSPPIRLISNFLILFSTPLLLIHIFIWTEPIFNLFLIFTIIALNRYLHLKNESSLVWVFVFSILMCLQRKSGILFTFPIFLTLLFADTQGKFNKKLLKGSIYFIISSSPFFYYLFTRKSSSGIYFTDARFQPEKFSKVVEETFHILTTWLFPDELSLITRLLAGAFLFILFLLVARYSIRFNKIRMRKIEYILLTIFIFYIVSILTGFLFVNLDQPFDDRIFASAYIPGMLLFCFLLDSIYKKISLLPFKNATRVRRIFIAMLCLWLIYPIARTCYNAKMWNAKGPGGYNSIRWNNNKTIKHLAQLNTGESIIKTENPFPIFYFLTVKEKKKVKFAGSEYTNSDLMVSFDPNKKHEGEYDVVFQGIDGKIFSKK